MSKHIFKSFKEFLNPFFIDTCRKYSTISKLSVHSELNYILKQIMHSFFSPILSLVFEYFIWKKKYFSACFATHAMGLLFIC